MMGTMTGMDAMMGGGGSALAMGLMMVVPTLVGLALLVLLALAIVWLVRQLRTPSSGRS